MTLELRGEYTYKNANGRKFPVSVTELYPGDMALVKDLYDGDEYIVFGSELEAS